MLYLYYTAGVRTQIYSAQVKSWVWLHIQVTQHWASGTRESLELAACQPIPRSSETVSRQEARRRQEDDSKKHPHPPRSPACVHICHTPLSPRSETHTPHRRCEPQLHAHRLRSRLTQARLHSTPGSFSSCTKTVLIQTEWKGGRTRAGQGTRTAFGLLPTLDLRASKGLLFLQ